MASARFDAQRLQALLPHAAVAGLVLGVIAFAAATGERRLYLLGGLPVVMSYFLWGPFGSALLATALGLLALVVCARTPFVYAIPIQLASLWVASRVSARVFERQILKISLAREQDLVASAEIEAALERERARIGAARQRIEKIGMLTSVASDLGATLELREVVEATLRRTRELTGQSGEARLVVFDDQGSKVYRTGPDGLSVAREETDVLCTWVRERGLPLLVGDLRREPRFRSAEAELPACRSFIAAPLSRERQVMGVLAVGAAEPNIFSQEDWRLLSLMSDLASVAIQNALLYQRTQEEAITDGLTEVFVHRHFQERLTDELRRAVDQTIPLTLLMADIDNFKRVNDTHGHLTGDAVLRRIARALRDGVRGTDLVARYGGEEFAVLLVETPLDAGAVVADRLRASVEALRFDDAGFTEPVTVSIGAAGFPGQASDERGLIEKADEALYAAKRAGKNRVTVAG